MLCLIVDYKKYQTEAIIFLYFENRKLGRKTTYCHLKDNCMNSNYAIYLHTRTFVWSLPLIKIRENRFYVLQTQLQVSTLH